MASSSIVTLGCSTAGRSARAFETAAGTGGQHGAVLSMVIVDRVVLLRHDQAEKVSHLLSNQQRPKAHSTALEN